MAKNFGAVVGKARRSLRIKMRELAEKMGWSLSLVSEIEHGRRKPPSDETVIKKLAKILKLEEQELIVLAARERIKPQSDDKVMDFFRNKGDIAMTLCRELDGLDTEYIERLVKGVQRRKSKNEKQQGNSS